MNNTKICHHCGIEETDDRRMQKCTGCNSSKILYCSRECQKLAWPSHKNRCRRKSNKASKLILNENIQNFDLVLSYASRYMKNLKYVNLSIRDTEHSAYDITLSAGALRSFLQTNRGQIEKFVWSMDTNRSRYVSAGNTDDGLLWSELHDLKVMQILQPVFGKCQHLVKVISQQEDSILALGLMGMLVGKEAYRHGQNQWTRNDCEAIVTSIGNCKNLVQLNLNQHYLRDSDMEILLRRLPKLQILNLCGSKKGLLTDKCCKTISRACTELRELDLAYHNRITVAGVKRVFKSCQQLRMFQTSLYLSSKDAVSLVCMAPNLLSLHTTKLLDEVTNYDVIMASSGRTVLVNNVDGSTGFPNATSLTSKSLPHDVVTEYERNRQVLGCRLNLDITRPDLVNGWEEVHLWQNANGVNFT